MHRGQCEQSLPLEPSIDHMERQTVRSHKDSTSHLFYNPTAGLKEHNVWVLRYRFREECA